MPVPSAATVLPRASSAPRWAAWSMPSARPLVTVQPAAAIAAPSARAVPAPCSDGVAATDDGDLGPPEPLTVADAVEDQRRIRQVQQAWRVAWIREREDPARGVSARRVGVAEPSKRGGDALVARRVGPEEAAGEFGGAEHPRHLRRPRLEDRLPAAPGAPAAPAHELRRCRGCARGAARQEVRRWTAGNLPRSCRLVWRPGAGAAGTRTVI